MLKKIKITERLLIGFGVLIAVFVSLMFFNVNRMESLSEFTGKMYRRPLVVSNAVLKVDKNIIKIHRTMKDIVLARDVEKIKEYENIVDNLEVMIYRDFEIIAERFLGDSVTYERPLKHFKDWKPIRDEVIALMYAGQRDKAAAITRGKGARHVEELEKSIAILIDHTRKNASSFLEGAENTRDNALMLMYLLIAAAIICGVIFALLFTKGIMRPITILSAATKAVGEGNLDTEIEVGSGDEIGDLAWALNEMRLKLKESYSGFEVIIKAKTRELAVTLDEAKGSNIQLIETRDAMLNLVEDLEDDITERKKAESALWESEERFRTIVEQSPVSIQVMDPDGRAIQVNRAWEKLWGITMEDMGDYTILEDKQLEALGVMPYLKKGFSGEAAFIPAKEYDVAKTLGKGMMRWVQARIYPVKDENGDIRIVVLMHEDISDQKEAELNLNKAFKEISRLKEELEAENVYLREEVKLQHEHGEILGESDAIKGTLKLVERVAGTDSTVLILGETGTGKELLAQSIHNLSKRKDRPIVKVNCAAIPVNLIESELFGREKGAYTGAMTTQVGRFEVANGSTLFLDEIGELSPELQAKLLRVLQDGRLERLGSTRTIEVDVRVIAATNRDLEQAVEDGTFRTDLYYRLNVFPITVPPLRERNGDILLLLWSFVREFEKEMGKKIESIPKSDILALQSYSWPGNVREMKNLIERSMILTGNSTLRVKLPQMSDSVRSQSKTLDEIQKDHISSVLERTSWRVRGEDGAAKILGLKPTTLDAKMKKLGIKR